MVTSAPSAQNNARNSDESAQLRDIRRCFHDTQLTIFSAFLIGTDVTQSIFRESTAMLAMPYFGQGSL